MIIIIQVLLIVQVLVHIAIQSTDIIVIQTMALIAIYPQDICAQQVTRLI
jgi:hypothetical protein